MKRAHLIDLDKITEITSKVVNIIKLETKKPLEVIAIFDLANSTNMKLEIGHDETIKKIFLHNQICRQIIKRFNGQVIKEMGDGLLAIFENPLNACLAAINIQISTANSKVFSKAALALGIVEEFKFEKNLDIFGTTVDLCARIEKCAFANQILIDRSLYDIIKSEIVEFEDIKIGNSLQIILKGIGKCELYELTSEQFELKNLLNNPNYININDGVSFDEKLKFISSAKTNVFEVGIDSSEFLNYDLDKETITNLLEQGIGFTLAVYISELDADFQQKLLNIKKLAEYFRLLNLPGKFELFLSQDIPMYGAICVDGYGEDGTLIVTNYLNGIKNELCPVFQISKMSNSNTFRIYFESIQKVISDATLL